MLHQALATAQILILLASAYQTVITVSGLIRYRAVARAASDRAGATTGRSAPPSTGSPAPRLAVLVCARNEGTAIGGLVSDLLAQDYPADRVRILVVAHNCTDDTADVARGLGADVIEIRTRAEGKGQALVAGFHHLCQQVSAPWRPDFVGVFDADSRLRPSFLRQVAAALGPEACLQVETAPLVAPGWLGRDHGLGRRARNVFWWRPREALGLGTTINGSGYFLRPDVAVDVLRDLRTVTEELEVTARLYARGHRVAYLSSTRVELEEPDRLASAFQQRSRWARGHLRVLCRDWPRVILRGARGHLAAADIALHMIMPTRVITRTGVSLAFIAYAVSAPFALPWQLVVTGLVTEWVVPLVVAVWQGLVPPSPTGLALAARRSVIGLLWFPVGLWSLVTAKRTEWRAVARQADRVTGHGVPSGPCDGPWHAEPTTEGHRDRRRRPP
jgi:cellulose synthase/poly-beta-1,6-N-acetylglucosamine synthase-like glycosyltransferase